MSLSRSLFVMGFSQAPNDAARLTLSWVFWPDGFHWSTFILTSVQSHMLRFPFLINAVSKIPRTQPHPPVLYLSRFNYKSGLCAELLFCSDGKLNRSFLPFAGDTVRVFCKQAIQCWEKMRDFPPPSDLAALLLSALVWERIWNNEFTFLLCWEFWSLLCVLG